MKTVGINPSLIDGYFMLLKSLSHDHKLELISKLSDSLKTSKTKTKDQSWKALFGAWELDADVTADDFVEDLRKDRVFTRKSIDL